MQIILKDFQNLIDRMPINQYLHLQILEVGEGYSKIRMPYNPVFTTLCNSIHDGALMTLSDITFFMAMATINGLDISTSCLVEDIKTSFISPSRESELYAEGKVINGEMGEVNITNTSEKLISHSIITYVNK
jgi:acyl-CoA thioesterase